MSLYLTHRDKLPMLTLFNCLFDLIVCIYFSSTLLSFLISSLETSHILMCCIEKRFQYFSKLRTFTGSRTISISERWKPKQVL